MFDDEQATDSESFRLQQEEFAKRQAELELASSTPEQPQLILDANAVLDPQTFESHWISLPVGYIYTFRLISTFTQSLIFLLIYLFFF